MKSPLAAGRLVGILTLAQMVCGILSTAVLTAPMFGPPGFLVNAAAHADRIALSPLCALLTGVFGIVSAVYVMQAAGERAKCAALCLLALSATGMAMAMVEQINLMSMLSLSQAYAKASPEGQAAFQGLRLVVASARNWSHYLGLAVGGCGLVALYATMYRAALLPRAFALFGLAASALQIVAVSMPLFGHAVVFLLLAPLAMSQLSVGLWLTVKGFPANAGQ